MKVIKKFTVKQIHISTHTRPCCIWIRRSLTLSSTCWTCGKKQISLKYSVNHEVIPTKSAIFLLQANAQKTKYRNSKTRIAEQK